MTDQHQGSESEIVELVRSIDVKAPESLHRRLESMLAERAAGGRLRGGRARARARRRFASRPRLGAAGAIVAAAVAVAIALGTSGSGSSPLSERAAALTLRPATQAAPRESRTNHTELAAAVEGVSFPYWEDHLGWRTVGARRDRIASRSVTTVFYADGRDRRVGYAIVGGSPAPAVSGGRISWREGIPYRLSVHDGAAVVSWLRHGHLCIVSGRGIGGATLLGLASWGSAGSVAS
jgi:hypothetical protein